ncbi:adenylate/guanylate cyclase domain-containing protein [Roseofilum casamattae]|uniref:Adenylate/guanylate cyclase domain-containing protein n=1 Tax=Roseofilum casamattae BLCC-M143 TaxID=3022442 RepID=A0ABT7BRX6_9CYAN|nr:adenylate/guanylate cyclase domain-containing protein [Roseofilum casamattae]MDJ1181953.1 adenylate/guanylate cyclase domain-containing protein [Roseofilum casamattae BLCC-M143]
MSIQFSTIINLFSAQLSRKIATWIFLSLIAIEALLLIPSYYQKEQDELEQLEEVSWAIIDVILSLTSPEMYADKQFRQKVETLTEDSIVTGISIYDRQGELLFELGDTPEISFAEVEEKQIVRDYYWKTQRYDVAWSAQYLNSDYTLVARHNAERLQPILTNYKLRIMGLVAIIAIAITISTLLVLGITVITPILRLRDDLISAGEILSHHHDSRPEFYSFTVKPDNELGEVMQAFHSMFCRVHEEQEKSERLLLNILPEAIASELKNGRSTIADGFPEVTVMFADLVGFTSLADRFSPRELVEVLNEIFSEFDALTERHQLEKIKTIGDAYMVVGGIPMTDVNHTRAIAEMAIDMQKAIANFSQTRGETFQIRIGINTGPVVAGVIGTKKFSYDLWGDTVNTASRMESHGIPGKIQMTQSTYDRLKHDYKFKEREQILIKGKGIMKTYLLMGRI